METLSRCAEQDRQGCSVVMRWKIPEVTEQRKPPELCLGTAVALQQVSPRAASSWCPLLLKLVLSELCAALDISSVLGQGRLLCKLFG